MPQKPVQQLSGALARSGPQPVDPGFASSAALGDPAELPAATAANSTINAKLGAIMFSLAQIVDLLETLVVHVKEGSDAE